MEVRIVCLFGLLRNSLDGVVRRKRLFHGAERRTVKQVCPLDGQLLVGQEGLEKEEKVELTMTEGGA